MDHRRALAPGYLLDFPGMPCTLESEIGRGSNAIVYRASYPDLLNTEERHDVLVKELFPFHRKGAIARDGNGDVVCEPDGMETMALHRRSFEYGNKVHLRMLAMHPEMDNININSFQLHGTSYTVLGYTGGRSLAQEFPGEATDLRLLAVRMKGLLDALDAFHGSGFLHLDIAPDNILLIGHGSGERVMLIDYNSAVGISQASEPMYYSVKQGYSAPEIRTGKRPSAASDLYSVTAVFFSCLTGKPLTPFQASRPSPPDVSRCPCLRELPDTVADMVGQILRRGLQSLPQRRYQTVAQMREAVQELLDRIDGVGITHWALWESGRRTVDRITRINPALAYIYDREELFPANIRDPDGKTMPAGEYIESALCSRRGAAILTAPGGMGKTTALLRTVAEGSAAYDPSRPAILYLSLYGWKARNASYVHDRILENLHFKPEHRSFEDARLALDQLMDKPLPTKRGERPALLILLDGLNEAEGETQALLDEIQDISHRNGVSILIATRSGEAVLSFSNVCLEPLDEEEVSERLSRCGILLPESPVVRELLQTPLMLSIFIRSSQAEQRQLSVQNRDELIQAYLSSLLSKELNSIPEDTEARWQIDAAISFVLPAIAGEVGKKGVALPDSDLLPAVERCYRCFSSRILRKAFPQWIGHSRAIRGKAANAEEWYGLLVHDLLWKRLGLLMRDERGVYLVSHQILAEYLTDINRQNQTRLRKRWRIGMASLIIGLLVTAGASWGIYGHITNRPAYSIESVEDVLTFEMNGYMEAGHQYAAMRNLLECATNNPDKYAARLESSENSISQNTYFGSDAGGALARMLESGEVMPGTRHGIDGDLYTELTGFADARRSDYLHYMAILTYIMEDERASRLYGGDGTADRDYPVLLMELVETDGNIARALYQMICEPYILNKDVLPQQEIDQYKKMLATIDSRYVDLKGISDGTSLDALRNRRNELISALAQHPVNTLYEMEEKT